MKPQITDNTIYIIGGGPAGLAAAISAHDEIEKSWCQKNTPSPKIIVLEKAEKIGQSILRTGNGRCNFSNANIECGEGGAAYNHPKFFDQVTEESSDRCVSRFFDELGLGFQIKKDGMMFPYTNKATSVLDVLRFAVEKKNIKVYTEVAEEEITALLNNVLSKTQKKLQNVKIIFAMGGNDKTAYNLLSQKVKIEPAYKVLGPIKTSKQALKNLDGIRANVSLSVIDKDRKVFCETGEILFRKYGVSGIVAFNASRFLNSAKDSLPHNKNGKKEQTVKTTPKLIIDFFPGVKDKLLEEAIQKRIAKLPSTKDRSVELTRIMVGLLLPQVTRAVLDNDNIKNTLATNKTKLSQQIKQAAKAFKNFELQNAEIYNPKQCQVSRGGIKTTELDTSTMRIKKLKKVYAAGECIDIDGPCGGYNLHWAWLSGIVAGTSAAKALL